MLIRQQLLAEDDAVAEVERDPPRRLLEREQPVRRRPPDALRQVAPPRADHEVPHGLLSHEPRLGRHGAQDAFFLHHVLVGAGSAREPAGAHGKAEEGAEQGAGQDPEEGFAFGVQPAQEGSALRFWGSRCGGGGRTVRAGCGER